MPLLTMVEYADIDNIAEYGYPVVYCPHCGTACIAETGTNPHQDLDIYKECMKQLGYVDDDGRVVQWTCRYCHNVNILMPE